jgi:inner membrane protein involved in colicin E2 resistance
LPDWLSPKDFQQSDRTVQYLILAIAIALITIIVLVVIKQRKR